MDTPKAKKRKIAVDGYSQGSSSHSVAGPSSRSRKGRARQSSEEGGDRTAHSSDIDEDELPTLSNPRRA